MSQLLAIDAPHFFAGVCVENGRVVRCAPIVKYMRDWSGDRVLTYCRDKGWSVAVLGNSIVDTVVY